jgi:hypothetical protein
MLPKFQEKMEKEEGEEGEKTEEEGEEEKKKTSFLLGCHDEIFLGVVIKQISSKSIKC